METLDDLLCFVCCKKNGKKCNQCSFLICAECKNLLFEKKCPQCKIEYPFSGTLINIRAGLDRSIFAAYANLAREKILTTEQFINQLFLSYGTENVIFEYYD